MAGTRSSMRLYFLRREDKMSRVLSRVLVGAALVILVTGGGQAADPKQPIKIGRFSPCRGRRRPSAHPPSWWRKWWWIRSTRRGHKWQPLELIIGDTESDPAKAATIAKNLSTPTRWRPSLGPPPRARDAGEEDRGRGGHPHLHDRGG